jgi:3-hydroxyisobutyrate dehydrogenase-like beta-hydroxyacid dehydrogenase
MSLRAVGLLSPGDMGHVVGQVLVNNGMPVLTCLIGRSNRTRMLARKADIKVEPTYEDLVRKTDIILSILVPGEAENVARKVVRALDNVRESTVYVDCNALSPATSIKIDRIIRGAGSKYVDASIIGPPPRREGVTKFFASGPDVNFFEALCDYGLEIRNLGPEIGLGKGIKMVYAALTKGLTAISTQLLTAAWKMGLYDELIELFKETQAVQYNRMERAILAMPPRSRRWVSEMEEISSTFEVLGMTPNIYRGAAELYRFIGATSLADETPESLDHERTLRQVIQILGNELK